MKPPTPFYKQFSRRAIRNTLLLVCVGAFCLMQQAHGDAPPVKEKLHVTELLKDVGIIGKLGYPLGTLATVRGTWTIDKRKTVDGTDFFIVKSINGATAPHDLEFARGHVRSLDTTKGYVNIQDGEEWELCCYEEGYFDGYPSTIGEESKRVPEFPGGGYLLETDEGPNPLFSFRTRLIYIRRNRK